MEAKADYLVSEDRDLLDLVQYEGTRIVRAHEFLDILNDQRKAAQAPSGLLTVLTTA